MHFSKSLIITSALSASITKAVELNSKHDLAQVGWWGTPVVEEEEEVQTEEEELIATIIDRIEELEIEIEGLKAEDTNLIAADDNLREHDSQQDTDIQHLTDSMPTDRT